VFVILILSGGMLSWIRIEYITNHGDGIDTYKNDKVTKVPIIKWEKEAADQEREAAHNTRSAINSSTTQQQQQQQQQQSQHDHHDPSCMTFNNDIENLINQTQQVFITMLPKSSGSSVKAFVKACTKATEGIGKPDFLSLSRDTKRDILTKSYDMHKVMASYTQTDDLGLITFIKGMTDESLWIHLYRPETDRLLSAIKQVVKSRLCKSVTKGNLDISFAKRNGTECIIGEHDLVNEIILKGKIEIGKSNTKILTCDLYNAIEENAPNAIFVNYQQSSRVQAAVTRKYCPGELEHDPIQKNVDAEKDMRAYVELVSTGERVLIDEWVEKKRNHLEWALELNSNVTCRSTTRQMERKIRSCPDGAINILYI
jgi:hypothetical protein